MQAAQRASRNTEEEVSKRKEKERKREEKELRKIAKAAGVKMVKPVVTAVAPSGPSSDAAGSSGPKKSGWAAVATAPVEPPKTSGWATVGEVLPPASNRGGLGIGFRASACPKYPRRPSPAPTKFTTTAALTAFRCTGLQNRRMDIFGDKHRYASS